MQNLASSIDYAGVGPRRVTQPKRSVAGNGDTGGTCHVVVEGVLASCHLLANGKEQIVGYHLPGDVCGLSSFIGNSFNEHIIAVTPAVSAPIPLSSLIDLADGSSSIGRALLRQMAIDAAIARNWITNLGQRSAVLRIAHLLCELEARFGAVGLSDNSSFPWFGTQKDFGDATGLSLVHVNRSLQSLKADGLVEWKKTTVRILDLDRLQALVAFDPDYLGLDAPRLGDLLSATGSGGGRHARSDDLGLGAAKSGIASAANGE